MPTLRQLRFLTTLADTLSFSRAAERCHVTQPTISAALKELEAELGVSLVERSRHRVLMTSAGKDIARRAIDVLAGVEAIEERAAAETGRGAETVRLGAIPTVGPFVLPSTLKLVQAERPGLKLLMREDLTEPLVARLVTGQLDGVVIALPFELPHGLHVEPLFQDGYALATPRDHPLANRPEVDGNDLADRHLLLLERGHCLQRHALSAFPAAALVMDETFAATSLPTLIAMVEQGLGLTLLPSLAVAAGAAKGHDIALTAVPGAKPRHVVLVWRTTSAKAGLLRVVARALLATTDRLGAPPAAAPAPAA